MIQLFRVSIPTSVLVLIASELLLISACLLLATWVALADDAVFFLLYEDGIAKLLLVLGSVILTFYFQDLYNDFSVRSRMVLLESCVTGLGFAFIVQSVVAYLFSGWVAPGSVLLVSGVFICMFVPLWHVGFLRFFMPVLGANSVLFLGANSLSQEIVTSVHDRPELAIHPIGFVADEHDPGSEIVGLKVLGPISDFQRIVNDTKPDCIVVGLEERRQKLPLEDLLRLRLSGVRIEEAATTFQTAFSRVPTRALRHSQLIFSSELGPLPRNLRLQTIYSVLIAAVGLTLAAPLMVLVAILVRLTSRGPVLFRQTRVGMGGRPFTIYKFRSMVANAEAGTGAVWARRDDPRVTPLGRFMRKTRIDELPQLFNVMRLEMSIVGPRPERPEFVDTLSELIPFYSHRHSVKPGITGWAQINYRYGESVQDAVVKLEYDMYYIKNLSPALDFFIMLHTLKAMLSSNMGH
jgi:exopolysaccharide biosynthesis polyprenyl glycosylphosphotransferase